MITFSGPVEKKSSGSMVDEIINSEDWSVIKDHMADFNMTEEEYTPEEIAESYINQMRYLDSGNVISAGRHLTRMLTADEDQKARSAKAYEFWDNMEGGLAEGRPWSDRFDTFKDYAVSVATDPATYIGLGVGKAVTSGGIKAVTAMGKRAAIKTATKNLGKEVAKKSPELLRREANKIHSKYVRRALQSEATKKTLRATAKRGALAAGLSETAVGALGVYGAQKAKILSGYQEEVDKTQIALVLGGGVGMSFLSSLLAKSTLDYERVFAAAQAGEGLDQLAREAAEESAKKVKNNSAKIKRKLNKELKEVWEKNVERGRELGAGSRTLDDVAYNREQMTELLNQIEKTILEVNGGVRPPDAYRGHWLAKQLEALDEPFKRKMYEDYQKSANITFDTYEEFEKALTDNFAVTSAIASEAGRTLVSFRGDRLSASPPSVLATTASTAARDGELVSTGAALGEKFTPSQGDSVFGFMSKGQRFWIQGLVTNPATTMLNLKGFAMASTSNLIQDTYRGLWYGTRAAASSFLGDQKSAALWGKKAMAEGEALTQQFSRLLNPEATYQELLDYLGTDFKRMNKMFYAASGGVNDPTFKRLKELGADASEEELEDFIAKHIGFTDVPRSEGKAQQVLGLFQKAYGVRLQDVLTKSYSWRNAIDRRLIEEFGESYASFMNNPKWAAALYKGGDEETVKRLMNVEAKAFDDTLKSVFSQNFGNDSSLSPGVQRIAASLENIRELPLLGTLFPFGQFFNNTISFMSGQSGFSILMKAAGVSGRNKTYGDLFTEAAGGLTIGIGLYHHYKSEMEDGLNFDETRDSSGQVVSKIYDFPENVYRAIAWSIGYTVRGEEPPENFVKKAVEAAGFGAFRGLSEGFDSIQNLWLNVEENIAAGDPFVSQLFKDLINSSVDMYVGGMTRPLEPFNAAVGVARGEDYTVPDRYTDTSDMTFRDALIPSSGSLRYVDQIASTLLGDEINEEFRSPVDNRKPSVQLSKFFGYRDVDRKSTIETMMDQAGYSSWEATEYLDDPVAKRVANSVVFPILEAMAVEVKEGTKWDTLTRSQKATVIKYLVTEAKRSAKEVISSSDDEEFQKTERIWDLNNKASRRDVNKIRMKFFEGRELSQLSNEELETIELILSLDDIMKENLLSDIA